MTGFTRSLFQMPAGWRVWIGILVLVNMIVPLFFLPRLEAIAVLVALMLGGVSQMAMFGRLGFVRLLGLGHIWWIPMLVWLSPRVDPLDPQGPFGYWILALFVVNSLSLLIDVTDVVRYVLGDREPQLGPESGGSA
jgi:hypothetical protein